MHDAALRHPTLARDCPICAGATKKLLFHQDFSLMSQGSLLDGYDVVICQNCGFGYADQIPEQKVFDAHYREMSKYEYQDSDGQESPYDLQRFRSISDLIISFLPDKESMILDIGCSTGKLLSLFKEGGYHNVFGLDPSPVCSATALRLHDISVTTQSVAELMKESRQFDCIILSGVLEHICDLNSFLKHIHAVISLKGILFIEVPDATRFAQWPDAPFQEFSTEHINFFSSSSVNNLMQHHGFDLETTQDNIRQQNYGTTMPVVTALYKKSNKKKPSSLLPDNKTEKRLIAYIEQSQQIEQRIHKIIDDLVANKTPIIVWGVGTHTLRLLTTSRLRQVNIQAFVDSNPRYQGKQLHGVPIITPKDLRERSEAILISTYVFQHAIERQIRDDLRLTNKIITLYQV